MEIGFTVVCVPEGSNERPSTAYVSAQQDRYVIKRPPTTPAWAWARWARSRCRCRSSEALVKVGSGRFPPASSTTATSR